MSKYELWVAGVTKQFDKKQDALDWAQTYHFGVPFMIQQVPDER